MDLGGFGSQRTSGSTKIRFIDEIQSIPVKNDEHGETDPNAGVVSITIDKHGHPNGIFKFTTQSQQLIMVDEPDDGQSPLPLTFHVETAVSLRSATGWT